MRIRPFVWMTGAVFGILIAGGLIYRDARAQSHANKQPAPACKITPVQAIEIALKKIPGRPLNANFELDAGHWIYGVMVVHGKTIREVEIDPMTGKVGDVETVTPDGESKEIRAALSRAIGAAVKSGKEEDEKGEKPEKL